MRSGQPSALRHYLRIFRRGAPIVLLTIAVVTGAAIALSQAQERLYESSAEVFLAGARNLPTAVTDAPQYSVDPERAANTQADLARTPEVAGRALKAAGVSDRSPTELLDDTTIESADNSDILRFTVTDTDAAVARRLSTSYARAFTDYRRQLDTGAIVAAREQIEQRLAALERARQVDSQLYRSLAADDQRLRTSEALQGENVALVNPGSKSEQVQPRTRRNIVLGGLFGLLLGVGLAFLREAFNTRVTTSEEVEERLEMPLLARIPKLPSNLTDGQVAMITDPHAHETEAFRMLATNLGFVNLDRGAKTIMVTSANRADGKSTVIASLAVSLARTGARVTLIDMDLRRPALRRLFGLEHGAPGLTSVALGTASLGDVLVDVPLASGDTSADVLTATSPRGSLSVLPTGPIPPDTADFVASARLTEVLREIGEQNDLVLIDAPPILHISDAVALTAKVDALFVVCRLAEIRRPVLDELRRVLDGVPISKLGFVLNGTRPGDGGYYGNAYAYTASRESFAANGKRESEPAGRKA